MDGVVVWSNIVLVLAVVPWLSYALVLLFFSLSILYGSVSLCLSFSLSLSLSLSVCVCVCMCVRVTGYIFSVKKGHQKMLV